MYPNHDTETMQISSRERQQNGKCRLLSVLNVRLYLFIYETIPSYWPFDIYLKG